MKKNVLRLLVTILIFYICLTPNLLAANEVNVDIDYTTFHVTISGNLGVANGLHSVNMYILYPDKYSEDVNLSASGVLMWADQTRATIKGDYSFNFTFSDNTGIYTIVLITDISATPYVKTVKFYGKDVADTIINELLNPTSSGIKAIMSDYIAFLQLNNDIINDYNSLGEDDKNKICDALAVKEYDTIDVFDAALETEIKLQLLNKLTDKSDFVTSVQNYWLPILPVSISTKYSSLDDNVKNDICTELMSLSYENSNDFSKAFSEKIVLSAVNNSSLTWVGMTSLLNEFNDVLNIDFGSFNKLRNKQNAVSNLLNVSFTSLEDIKNKFISAVNAAMSTEMTEGLYGGGASGGGTSSGSAITVYGNVSNISNSINNNGVAVFNDIASVGWAEASIVELAKRNIISGYGNGDFKPENNITRAEFSRMIATAFGIESVDGSVKFNDVNENDWFYPFIKALYLRGIINGINNYEYAPNENITRQDAAIMVKRATEISYEVSYENGFTDANNIADYAKEAVFALSNSGIINGYSDKSFKPLNNITRAEASVILFNTLKFLSK